MALVNVIAGLLKNNVESLNLPTILKTAVKKLQSLVVKTEAKVIEPKTEAKVIEPKTENAKDSVQTKEKATSTSGDGTEEQ